MYVFSVMWDFPVTLAYWADKFAVLFIYLNKWQVSASSLNLHTLAAKQHQEEQQHILRIRKIIS